MALIKIGDAFRAGADWISATVRSFFIEQIPRALDNVQDVRDNDLEQARWIFVRSLGAFYRMSLSSTASDDGDSVLRDNIGRRYIKATSAVQLGFGASGTLANRANYNGEAKGFVYAQTDQSDLILYIKESGTSGDWSEGFTWRGPPGVNGTNFSVDEIGTFSDRGDFDDEAPGFAYLSTDGDGDEIETAVIFIMGDGGSGDWSSAVPFQGPQGPIGPGATVEVGTVTDVAYGQPATVENSGTLTNAVLDFGLPQGAPGNDGANAYVYVAYASDDAGSDFTTMFDAGLDYIAILPTDTEIETPSAGDFAGLWKRYKGEMGENGADGEDFDPDEVVPLIADRDAFDDEPKGFAVLVESDAGHDDNPWLYFKLSADSADWSSGVPFGGGGGAVDSVNGQTGTVVLDADDILTDAGGTFGGADVETVLDDHDSRIVELDAYVDRGKFLANVKEFGAVGNGVADDAPAINDALSGGNKHVYFPAGRYRCESYLRVYANTKVELHPDAMIIHASDSSYLFLNGEAGNASYATGYTGEGNLWFVGGTIDCSPKVTAEELSEAIAIAHAENILIENMTFQNNYQDHFLELNSTRHGVVKNCRFLNTTLSSPGSRECINIDYAFSGGFPHFGGYDNTICDDILIKECVFRDGDVAAGSHSAPSSYHTNIRVVDCVIDTMETCGIDTRYWQRDMTKILRCKISNVPSNFEINFNGSVFLDGRHIVVVGDDQAVNLVFPRPFQGQNPQGMFMVGGWSNVAASPRGLYWAHCAATANCLKVAEYSGATDVDVTTGALSGTTGSDGKVTISAHTDGKLYIENRRGAILRLEVRFMEG